MSMINSLKVIFGSKTKAQEIVFLLNGVKEVVRQGFYPSELPVVEQFCKENALFLVKSKFKVLLEEEGSTFSNKCTRIPENDSRLGMYFVYLSKDEQKALLACYAEMMNRHKELGELLGYPCCCIEFFCKNFNEQNTNLELTPTNPWTNLSQREQDCVLLSHFPCSSECSFSIELAKRYFEVIKKVDSVRAEEMMKILEIK